ncbi:MAG: methyltransferase domain-containing protein [Thermoguttaceae bacterium]
MTSAADRQNWVRSMLRCPRCGSTLRWTDEDRRAVCSGEHGDCLGRRGYPSVSGQPALVAFERSVLSEAAMVESAGDSPVRRSKSAGILRDAVRKFLTRLEGGSLSAQKNCRRFLDQLKNVPSEANREPIVLNVGGAVVGSGARSLHDGPSGVRVACFDVYASPETDFVADAHDIPLPDGSVDGVWIQAVLEHVIEPDRVVAEIHRVLKPGGIVYAEIPFMQTVHEGAYDFTRWTDTGVRWLFRGFDRLDSGVALGPGSALAWSLNAALTGLFRSRKIGRLLGTGLFFWVRFLDRLIPRRFAIDTACGLYFFGRKADRTVSPKDVIASFQGVPT